jgi:hypothetical protein
MAEIIVFPTSRTVPPNADNAYWSLLQDHMILSHRLKFALLLMRYFAEGIHEYANRSGDSYLAQEAQAFLQQLD